MSQTGRGIDRRGAERLVLRILASHDHVVEDFRATAPAALAGVGAALVEALRGRHTLFFFGNGGSAADAQHLAAEFVNRFVADRPALPAIALTTDTSALTSIANDDAFERIFARQIEALGRKGDVAVGLSTSGRSPNVVAGLGAARDHGMVTVGMTGGNPREMGALCDHLISVPCAETARIQEVHILAGHILCRLVDDALFPPA